MTEVRTYHVSPWRRWSLWYVGAPMIAFLLFFAIDSGGSEGRVFLTTAGIVFLIFLPFQFIVDRARLQLSPEGARLRQTGYELAAPWSEIVDLRLAPGRQGFVTREPMAGKGAAVLAMFRWAGRPVAPLYDEDQRRLLAERRLIPIEAFAWHLKHGAMRDDIIRFAPHLAHLLHPPG
jgi:hypothetical protein